MYMPDTGEHPPCIDADKHQQWLYQLLQVN